MMKIKRIYKPYLYVFMFFVVSSLILVYSCLKRKPLEIISCTANINAGVEGEDINSPFQRVISIVDGLAFVKDTGSVNSDGSFWTLSRNYTFSLKETQKNIYSYEMISMYSSSKDSIPDAVAKKIRPDTLSGIKVIRIEEIQPKTWVFSGLVFPLFTCKEK